MLCLKPFRSLDFPSMLVLAAAALTFLGSHASGDAGERQLATVGTGMDLEIGEMVNMSFEAEGTDSIQIEVTLNEASWVAVGFSQGSVTSMTGQGEGSDLFVCADGAVTRYFTTEYMVNTGSVVENATCTQVSGMTKMTFSRTLAAASDSEIAITPGTSQQVIYAYSAAGSFAFDSHGYNAGGSMVDFATATVTETTPKTSVGTASNLAIGDVVSLSFEPLDDDSVKIEVKLTGTGWVGVGFSQGSTTSMTGQGEGSDIVVCADGEVLRYFTKVYMLSGGTAVSGASCSQDSGVTTLSFSRTLAAASDSEIAITPGTEQQVIWAYSAAGSFTFDSHGYNTGSSMVNFATDSVSETGLTTTAAPTDAMGTATDLALGDAVSMSFEPLDDDSAKIEVKLTGTGWIGLGFSQGSSISMTGGGDGSDLFVCADGEVTRYLTSIYSVSTGEAVSGATCTQESGVTTMSFSRTLAASSTSRRLSGEIAITPGVSQQVIFAYSEDGSFTFNSHGYNVGGKMVDFSSGAISEVGATATEPESSAETTTVLSSDPTELGTVSGVSIGEGVTLSFEPLSTDSVQIEVKLDGTSWVGVGFSQGTVTSMTGQGDGADIVVCAGGEVKRYFTTSYMLASGTTVPGASCTQESGSTIMRFSRTLAASGSSEIAIQPGSSQQVIWAYSDSGSFTLDSHGHNAGGCSIDFATGKVSDSGKKSGTALLFAHAICMLVAWAGLGPIGAIIARKLHVGKWFKYHRALQCVTVLLTILGFIFIVAEKEGEHFHSFHSILGLVIVALTILQPLNAVVRPHNPVLGEEKSTLRTAWEWLHRIIGWLLVVGGILNAIGGCLHARELDYDDTFFGVTLGIFMLFFMTFLCITILSFISSGRTAVCLRIKEPEQQKITDEK